MRVLLTGATGKIGNGVAGRLLARGDEVVCLVRDRDRAADLLPAEAQLAVGDVTDAASVQAAAEGVDAAINAMTAMGCDPLQIQRMKKKKLFLKDRLSALEDKIIPDIIA